MVLAMLNYGFDSDLWPPQGSTSPLPNQLPAVGEPPNPIHHRRAVGSKSQGPSSREASNPKLQSCEGPWVIIRYWRMNILRRSAWRFRRSVSGLVAHLLSFDNPRACDSVRLPINRRRASARSHCFKYVFKSFQTLSRRLRTGGSLKVV